MKLLSQILQRLKEPTPEFFRKVRLIGKWVVAIVVLINGLQTAGLPVPEFLLTLANYYTLSIGAFTIFFTSMASSVRDVDGNIYPKKVDAVEAKKIEEAKRMYDR